MIPYLLAIAGGYLLGDSMKESQTFADGGMMAKGERISDKGEVKYGELVVGNEYFQVKRPDLGIEKIKITEKENGTYKYKRDTDNYTDEGVVVKYQGRYTDNEKLYGIFEDKDEAKQMAIKLLTERMSKYADGGMMADGGTLGNIKSYRYNFDTYIEIEGTNYGGKLKLGYGVRNVGGKTETYPYLAEIVWDDNNVPNNSDEIETFVDKNLDNLLNSATN